MSDQNNPDGTPKENPNGSENPNTGQEPNGGENGKQEQEQNKIDWSKLPEELRFIERELNDARTEAAKRRTQSKDYLAKIAELEGKVPTEDVQSELKTWRTKAEQNEAELTKLRVISEVGIDPELGAFLTGTEEEMRNSAKTLKAKIKAPTPPTPNTPSGGSNPGEKDVPRDGLSTLQRIRAQRHY